MITTAPGKVVLLGEYAVLEGAPALVMAVDRRVRVSLRRHDDPWNTIVAPRWTPENASFEFGPGGLVWRRRGGEPLALAAHVIQAFFADNAGALADLPFRLGLDSTPLFDIRTAPPKKLGLGSSAALTVAMYRALSDYAALQQGVPSSLDLARLVEVHSGFQGGRGSGVDVAASLLGGLIEYRRSPQPRARPSNLPDDIVYCFVWSGRQVDTGRLLAGIEQWRQDNHRHYRQLLDALAEISEAGVRAAVGNEGDEFLRMLSEYAAALLALGDASGTDILSTPHRRLQALASRCTVVYKPCGAGGGDIGVGFSRDPGALARFQERLTAEGFQPLSLQYDANGVSTLSGN